MGSSGRPRCLLAPTAGARTRVGLCNDPPSSVPSSRAAGRGSIGRPPAGVTHPSLPYRAIPHNAVPHDARVWPQRLPRPHPWVWHPTHVRAGLSRGGCSRVRTQPPCSNVRLLWRTGRGHAAAGPNCRTGPKVAALRGGFAQRVACEHVHRRLYSARCFPTRVRPLGGQGGGEDGAFFGSGRNAAPSGQAYGSGVVLSLSKRVSSDSAAARVRGSPHSSAHGHKP